ncbi:hypothetical protein ACIQUQ_21640 [Streptomyces sp. NPDC101118]|uniref:effector-associated constant component EACC1 n=1 Tax=Streptomyces sp. NPDC101118 TaxID=3366109 RepID=UPI0038079746
MGEATPDGGVQVEFKIVGTGPEDETELQSLLKWLKQDPELRGRTTIRLVESEPDPEAMGGALEAVHVIINDAVAVAGLAVSVATWLASRSRQRPRTIRREGGDTVLAPDASPEEVQAVLEDGARPEEAR